jgi:pimeloyl-ACP methyl ester carboxylesterase
MKNSLKTFILFSLVSSMIIASCNETKDEKKDTYILVHSAWLGAWQWGDVKSELEAKNQLVITPDLPGHGSNKTSPADITMEHYVQTLLDIIDKQKDPVILVGHSFNGITVSRVAELRPKKIKGLVYLTAFLLPNGGSFFKAVQGVENSTAVENFYLSEDQTYALVKEEEIQNAFAHDIPKEIFDAAKPNIVPEPSAPLQYELQISDQNLDPFPNFILNVLRIELFLLLFKEGCIKETLKRAIA